MTDTSEEVAVCPTDCDPDCDAVCHEDHVAGHKKDHWPYDCPAADRYGWGGSDFIAAAVKQLKAERDGVRTELARVQESLELSEAQLVEVTLERAEWRKRAQRYEAIAKILRADLARLQERIAEAIRDFPGPNPSPADPTWWAGYREAQAHCADIAAHVDTGEAANDV